MGELRRRHVLFGVSCAAVTATVATALVLVFSGDSKAAPTKAEYFARVAVICRVYGPQLDKIRPPDVSEPASVIVAIQAVFPLLEAQQRDVRALRAPEELRTKLARWFDLHDRRLGMLEEALRAAHKQDYLALSVAYVDFVLAAPQTARLGKAIGFPHPPC